MKHFFFFKVFSRFSRIGVYQGKTETRIFHGYPAGRRPAAVLTILLPMVHTPDVVEIVSVAVVPVRFAIGKHLVVRLRHVRIGRRGRTFGIL